nr:mitochondrial pyruvate carrier 4 isoform X4 [Ipomoea trifida]
MAASKLQALWNHPAGPKTIHFWAPTFKWGISIANIADFSKPPEKLSYPQQIDIVIWLNALSLLSSMQRLLPLELSGHAIAL